MKPCNKSKKEICTKEEEDISIIWKRKKNIQVHQQTIKKEIH